MCGDRTLRLKKTVPEATRAGFPVSRPKEGSTPTTTWDHLIQTPAFWTGALVLVLVSEQFEKIKIE